MGVDSIKMENKEIQSKGERIVRAVLTDYGSKDRGMNKPYIMGSIGVGFQHVHFLQTFNSSVDSYYILRSHTVQF